MTTIELRTSLMSEVTTLLDDDELMREAIRMLRGLRNRLKVPANAPTTRKPAAEQETAPDTKEYILKGIKEAFLELNEVKASRSKDVSIEELLTELEQEEGA